MVRALAEKKAETGTVALEPWVTPDGIGLLGSRPAPRAGGNRGSTGATRRLDARSRAGRYRAHEQRCRLGANAAPRGARGRARGLPTGRHSTSRDPVGLPGSSRAAAGGAWWIWKATRWRRGDALSSALRLRLGVLANWNTAAGDGRASWSRAVARRAAYRRRALRLAADSHAEERSGRGGNQGERPGPRRVPRRVAARRARDLAAGSGVDQLPLGSSGWVARTRLRCPGRHDHGHGSAARWPPCGRTADRDLHRRGASGCRRGASARSARTTRPRQASMPATRKSARRAFGRWETESLVEPRRRLVDLWYGARPGTPDLASLRRFQQRAFANATVGVVLVKNRG